MIIIVQRFFGHGPQNDMMIACGIKTGGRGARPYANLIKTQGRILSS